MVYVNTHIHSPYSFSGFESIDDAAKRAAGENVRVLGLSDFNTVKGFEEFQSACLSHGVYPLYNIEFIALLEGDRKAGRRWNDPVNPGVMYVCGKALAHPSTLSDDSRNRLRVLWKGTQDHIWRVIQKLNDHLSACAVPIALDYGTIRTRYAMGTVRERHVARALVDAVRERGGDDQTRETLRTLYGDASVDVDISDDVAVQNQIRDLLLKAGKPAFVGEERSAFFSLEEVRMIVLDGGGVPCYPVLADDRRGLGEFESDPESLAEELAKRQFYAVEFIPARNSLEHLKRYVNVLRSYGFCVTFGTEHNTPGISSLRPSARDGVELDDELREIGYEGACILAAHAKVRAEGHDGYVDDDGRRRVAVDDMATFARIGDEAIRAVTG